MKTPGNQKLLKKSSRDSILNIVRDFGLLSRVDIAEKSGLGWGTITKYTKELIDEGALLESKADGGKNRRGRKPLLIKLNTEFLHFIGIDMGARTTSIVMTDFRMEPIIAKCIKTRSMEGPEEVLKDLFIVIEDIIKESGMKKNLAGIAIGVSGAVDFDNGVVVQALNFTDFTDVPIRDSLERKFGVPVIVTNSLITRLMAAYRRKENRRVKDMVYVWIGTGVGSGVISEGRLLMPMSRERVGDIGHIMIEKDGARCKCGLRGCLEAYLGAGKFAESSDAQSQPDNLMRSAEHLCEGLLPLVQLYKPGMIVIDGRVVELGESFLEMIRAVMRKKLPPERFAPENIWFSSLERGKHAIGGAYLLWDRLLSGGFNREDCFNSPQREKGI